MLRLCGSPLSNYYNKVKFVLLEHDIPFDETLVKLPIDDPALLADMPLGKVPFLLTEHGSLCESQAIVEYLAAIHSDKRIFPADPFDAAKAREITTVLELYLEWNVRELFPEAFFGGKVSDGTKAHVEKRMPRALDGFKRLAKFSPYVLGDTFCIADIAAFVHLPIVALATKAIYGRDFIADAGIDWKAYVKRIEEERPAAKRVRDERKAFIAGLAQQA
ncbi:putative gst-related protein [Burkholderia thailandensis MSMB121]|uniref:Glutathione S-transferase n=1 Tax=Burkholderia humptydooensis TaxID=430531 RepID=A0A7U4P7M1_9BURK|nr:MULTISPECIES: glutathione S-transferase [Burkholderia]AGK46320.1 putative gst-related protein [Burkholderia thailandensis MSMB121]AJY42465.1 putative gst-related protein [Burkholderia sp. 2002721687]ALX44414.1 glutathione S-transferase [Burkholderia humptydooensis]KST76092.1 glutathione S-transferase [Burkholderia humptydooensis]QPS44878.1 glutathione S-transferase [Burkholderia humptydooensis]